MLEDAEQFKEEIGCQQRSDLACIVRRRDLYEIASDDLQSTERANQFENLHACQPADLRRSRSRSVGRIHDVKIQGDVRWLAPKGAQKFLHHGDSLAVKLLCRHHLHLVFAREIEVLLAIDLSAQADLQNTSVLEEPLLERATERRSVRIFAAKVFIPEVVVRVELNQ